VEDLAVEVEADSVAVAVAVAVEAAAGLVVEAEVEAAEAFLAGEAVAIGLTGGIRSVAGLANI
jgi:hypothetical protein